MIELRSKAGDPLRPVTWISTLLVLAALLAVLVFALPYAAGYGEVRVSIATFLGRFWQLEDWQHCWLVVPAVAVMIYLKREALKETPVASSWVGLGAVVLSLSVYWAGYVVENYYLGYAAIQLFIGGAILWVFGWGWMKHLLFPWLFLCFAWPILFLDSMVAFPLRMVMSDASAGVLQLLGVPVIQSGTAILSAPEPAVGLPAGANFSVDVADPCSGIRSLFALMMVSALYAYLAVQGLVKQVIVFLCSVPLAILGNLTRILMLTFGVMMFGAEIAIGTHEEPSFYHMLAGYLVFLVAIGGLILIGWLLNSGGAQLLALGRSMLEAAKTKTDPAPVTSVGAGKPEKFEDLY